MGLNTPSLEVNMPRPKKNKSLQVKQPEVKMTEQLELPSMTELETINFINKEHVQFEKDKINLKELDVIETEIDRARLELEKTKKEIEEQKQALKSLSSSHLNAKELAIVDKQIANNNERKALQQKIYDQKAYDNVKVTGRFTNRRAPGQMAKLAYIKYADDPVKWYEFHDGGIYTIPRGFADQINEHYYSPHFIQNTGAMDPDNPESNIAAVDTSNKKYMFSPVNF